MMHEANTKKGGRMVGQGKGCGLQGCLKSEWVAPPSARLWRDIGTMLLAVWLGSRGLEQTL